MPEIVVYALEGRSVDQKRGLVKDLTSAMVKNYGVPADAVVVTVVEPAKHDKAKGGVLFSEMSTPARQSVLTLASVWPGTCRRV